MLFYSLEKQCYAAPDFGVCWGACDSDAAGRPVVGRLRRPSSGRWSANPAKILAR